jgi:hypothetical protein
MEQVGFPLTDPLFALVDAAYDAVHRLRIHVHFMTCDGVGENTRRAGGEQDIGGKCLPRLHAVDPALPRCDNRSRPWRARPMPIPENCRLLHGPYPTA